MHLVVGFDLETGDLRLIRGRLLSNQLNLQTLAESFFNPSVSEKDFEAALRHADEFLGRMGLAPSADETAAR